MKTEKAIEILESRSWSGYDDQEIAEAVQMGAEALKEQRPRGEWKTAYLDHVSFGVRPKVIYCSECQMVVNHKENFCPNCGSDNR